MPHMTWRLHRDEKGVGLVELLVVLVVMSVVGGIVLSSIVTGMRTTTRAQDRIDALTELETGVQRLARELRAACQVNTFDGDDVSVNIVRGGEVHRYRYVLGSVLGGGATSDVLYEVHAVRDPSTGSFVAAGTRPFLRDLDNATVFAYQDPNGDPPEVATQVSSTRLTLIRRLPDQNPIEVSTRVHLRNSGGFTCAT